MLQIVVAAVKKFFGLVNNGKGLVVEFSFSIFVVAADATDSALDV